MGSGLGNLAVQQRVCGRTYSRSRATVISWNSCKLSFIAEIRNRISDMETVFTGQGTPDRSGPCTTEVPPGPVEARKRERGRERAHARERASERASKRERGGRQTDREGGRERESERASERARERGHPASTISRATLSHHFTGL